MRWVPQLRARLQALPTWVVDGVVALSAFGLELWFGWMLGPHTPYPQVSWPIWVSVGERLLETVPLVVRRRYPRAVFGVVAATVVLSKIAGLPVGGGYGLAVALFTVGAYWHGRGSLMALGSLMVIQVLVEVWQGTPRLVPTLLGQAVAWTLGYGQQVQRGLVAELQREREHKARLAVAEERARIARDLHDVVAHSVSVMVVHTAAARRMLSKDPSRANEALAQVEVTGRQSLAELRRLLGLLREDGQASELGPQPQLAYLDDLVDQFRDAGLAVQIAISGQPRPLAAGVDLSAYRIVQEALTNALKHARASTVHVTLRYTAHTLEVEIVDDGRGIPAGSADRADGEGHGLVGMRERVALVSGQLQAGPRPEGGFRVVATLPLES